MFIVLGRSPNQYNKSASKSRKTLGSALFLSVGDKNHMEGSKKTRCHSTYVSTKSTKIIS
jgi:hypothetical protein